ncbi:MAG: GDP-mannose 4,6-dehydratase, partial [Spirochaetia bacterium]|nr:GDP-mannose 4,6-dehydratase [Spirochaetia bacterium]
MRFNNILITGGAGFIGSNLIRYIFEKTDFAGRIINLDKLTYAGNPLNIADIEQKEQGKRYFFEHGDICDFDNNVRIFKQYNIDAVIHLAAESHVDRSI